MTLESAVRNVQKSRVKLQLVFASAVSHLGCNSSMSEKRQKRKCRPRPLMSPFPIAHDAIDALKAARREAGAGDHGAADTQRSKVERSR